MTPYDKDALIRHLEGGAKFAYLFFWGHKPDPHGGIGPSCFSQWFEAEFEIDGVNYPTAEHYMMAEKSRLFRDDDMLQKICKASSPGDAKALGRRIKGFDDAVWCEHRFDIVVKGNMAKFSQNPRLGHYLRSTHPKILVEASPSDMIWGIGLHKNDPLAGKPKQWNGLNLLGFSLMKVRDVLLAQ